MSFILFSVKPAFFTQVSVDMDGRGPLPVVQVTCKLDQIVNMLRNLVS